MDKRRIGSLEVSVVGIGCNNFGRRVDERGTAAVVDAAIAAGINFFDTANMYGEGLSEEYLGVTLKGRRDRVILATKVGMRMEGESGGAAPDYVRAAADRSLRRLKTDYIDLYQLHQPDPETPIADTLGAFQDLVRAGKVREIGCSNFSAEQLREAEAAAAGGPRFVSVQNEYSMLHREPEAEVLSECDRLGIAFLPYFPLASALLTGKMRPGQAPPTGSRLSEQRYTDRFATEANLERVVKLKDWAESRNHTIIELAFSWLLRHQTVASVIAGARTPEQARSNAASGGWHLTSDEIDAVERILAA